VPPNPIVGPGSFGPGAAASVIALGRVTVFVIFSVKMVIVVAVVTGLFDTAWSEFLEVVVGLVTAKQKEDN